MVTEAYRLVYPLFLFHGYDPGDKYAAAEGDECQGTALAAPDIYDLSLWSCLPNLTIRVTGKVTFEF